MSTGLGKSSKARLEGASSAVGASDEVGDFVDQQGGLVRHGAAHRFGRAAHEFLDQLAALVAIDDDALRFDGVEITRCVGDSKARECAGRKARCQHRRSAGRDWSSRSSRPPT